MQRSAHRVVRQLLVMWRKTIVAIIDWDLSVQEAIEAPNVVYPRGAPIIEEGKV